MDNQELEVKKFELKVSNTISGLDESIQPVFKSLALLSDDLCELSNNYEKEANALDLEYESLYKPIYLLRSKVIQGEESEELNEEAILKEFDERQEELIGADYDKINLRPLDLPEISDNIKDNISEFWLQVLQNHKQIGVHIEGEDSKILKHLIDVELTQSTKCDDFTLKFYWSENEWFTNSTLTKIYRMKKNDCSRVDCTEMVWKEGKN